MTALNIQLNITLQPNNPFYPGPQYYFEGQAADPMLQGGSDVIYDVFYIATPANPSMNIYANLADCQTAFLANDVPPLIAQLNNDFGTSFSTLGTVSPFNQSVQNALAAVTPVTKTTSTVTRTINGTATQCSDSAHDNLVMISLNEAQSLSLSGGQTGTISFQTSPTSGGTYTTFSQVGNSNTGALVIGLNTIAGNGSVLVGFVPLGYYYKLVGTGTGTNTYVTGKEITF